MLVLIGIVPTQFVLNLHSTAYQIDHTRDAAIHLRDFYQRNQAPLGDYLALHNNASHTDLPETFRCDPQLTLATINTVDLERLRADLTTTTEYAPFWVTVGLALALGLGAMVGWRRVVL